jgi:hypothetical protein
MPDIPFSISSLYTLSFKNIIAETTLMDYNSFYMIFGMI